MQLHWLKKIENWLLPFHCLLCHNLSKNSMLCLPCQHDLPWLKNACLQCANPLDAQSSHCAACLQHPPPFNRTLAIFDYQPPIDHCILNLKFKKKLAYGKLLAELLAEKIYADYATRALPECIIPVPLHRQRLQKRGFNQAIELGRPLAKKLQIPLNKYVCQRVVATPPQASIPANQRKKNLTAAFQINKKFSATHVAILDDVVTTASTVTALALTLKRAGVKQIDVWCCARTTLKK